MKLLHSADWHLGKRVNDYSMIQDQKDVLKDLLRVGRAEEIDALLLAGDIYDKAVPSAEAVQVLDAFLTACLKEGWQVFIIPGNHDSASRLSFGSEVMKTQGIHLAGPYQGTLESVTLTDAYGPCTIHLLPFIKPLQVRAYQPDLAVGSYEEAAHWVISQAGIDSAKRNILLAHQYVTHRGQTPERSDSELMSLGGVDQVDASVFSPFDYVALGHLHGPQRIGRDTVRYAGSILKYSFSEIKHTKSVTLIDFKEKGKLSYRQIPLAVPRQMIRLEGSLAQLLDPDFYQDKDRQAYAHIILSDESALDALGKLRLVYPYLMRLDFRADLDHEDSARLEGPDIEGKSPLTLFEDFYQIQQDKALDQKKKAIIREILDEIGESS